MPITPTKFRIKDLTPINQEADLVDKVFEVENPSGSATDQNYQVSFPRVVQAVANNLPGGNNAKVAVKTARCYDSTNPNYSLGDQTLVGLNPDFLCLQTTCRVEFPRGEYVLVYDGTPGATLQVWRDGDFNGQKIPAKWVDVNSLDARVQGLADFSPFAFSYDAGDNVKYTLNGILRLFAAKVNLVKSTFTPQQIPAPTGLAADPNWAEINGGDSVVVGDFLPGNYKRHEITVFDSKLYRAKQDIVIGDFVNQAGTYDNFPDLDYWEIVGDGAAIQNPYDDTALTARVTAVEAGVEYATTTIGENYTEFDNRLNSIVSLAPDYAPGTYTKGQFVTNDGKVFTAKQNIANSSVAPTTTNVYWLQVSGGGGVVVQNSLSPASPTNAASIDAVNGGISNLQGQLDALPAPSTLVHTTGNETLGGDKTFTGTIYGAAIQASQDINGQQNLNIDGDAVIQGTLIVGGVVNANKFVGDGSQLTNLPNSGTSVTVEQNLTSGSTTSLPSVKAVADAIPYTPGAFTNSIQAKGFGNVAGSDDSVVAGGKNNRTAYSYTAVLGGYNNYALGSYAAVVGGNANSTDGTANFIGGGSNNRTSASSSVVVGGYNNSTQANISAIVGGQNNTVAGANDWGFIGAGSGNYVNGLEGASIVGGFSNIVQNYHSFIGAGAYNNAFGIASVVPGGIRNKALGDYSATGGGTLNEATGTYSVVPGGYMNKANGESSWAFGNNNTVNGNYSSASGRSNTNNGVNCHIYGSTGCTIPATCSKVVLINCTDFTVPAGVIDNVYIAGVLHQKSIYKLLGNNNTAANLSAVIGGEYATISGTGSVIIGGTDCSVSGNYSVMGASYNSSLSASYVAAFGFTVNTPIPNTVQPGVVAPRYTVVYKQRLFDGSSYYTSSSNDYAGITVGPTGNMQVNGQSVHMRFRGDYVRQAYASQDVVKYSGVTYVCTADHEPGASFDATKWTTLF